jgi:putative oxidoreductase
MTSAGLCVLRLALAAVFVAHGSNSLFGLWPGPGVGPGGLQYTADLYSSIGVHPSFLFAVLAAVTQVAGGLLLGAGSFTRWSAAALLIYVGIGIWKAHWRWGFFLNWTIVAGRGHGIEYSFLLAAALVCLLLTGAGGLSIDGRRSRLRAAGAAGRARLRGNIPAQP